MREATKGAQWEAQRRHWAPIHATLREIDRTREDSVPRGTAIFADFTVAVARFEVAAARCGATLGMDAAQTMTAVVALAVSELLGRPQLVLEIEHHGRTGLGGGCAETVGWFTAAYPVILNLSAELRTSLVECKDRIAASARHPHGDGLLRLGDDSIPRCFADATINYLGDLYDILGGESIFSSAELVSVHDRSPGEHLRSRLVIDFYRVGDRIRFHIAGDPRAVPSDLAASFQTGMERVLERIAIGLAPRDRPIMTATDLGADDLSGTEWLALMSTYQEE